ncbi:MAG UNVERIFIED_CONTAM: hypothetical protein LVT10_26900 [Anaerolineae bacterium]
MRKPKAKHRFAYDANGNELPKLQCVTYAEALFEAMIHRFYQDPTMVAYGERNRDWGGAFGVYRGLTGSPPVSQAFQRPDRRSRHRRLWRGIRAGRWACGGGIDVC